MSIDIKELKELSKKLYFDMSEEQYKTLQNEFDVILKQMELIGEIEGLEDVSPMVFPYLEPGLGLREDEPGETLKPEEVLQNASETMMNMVKVKKVVG